MWVWGVAHSYCYESHLYMFIGIGTGGGGRVPPQYFSLETLLIFTHAVQVAVYYVVCGGCVDILTTH